MEKRLYRDKLHGIRGGVCAGLAEYFQVDVAVVRLIFVVAFFLKGIGFVAYLILWAVLPQKPYQFFNTTVDYRVPPTGSTEPIPPVFTQPKKPSNVAVIVGAILILIGGAFLLDEFDMIPEIEFKYIWPLVFIAIGIGVLFTGKDKKPWEEENWHKKEKVEDLNVNDNNNTTTL